MALPFRNFATTLVTATNDAQRFWPFSAATLRWLPGDSDADGQAARDALGLGLHLVANAGESPVVLPASLGKMTCMPLRIRNGMLEEQRLAIELSKVDLKRLARDPGTGEWFPVLNARLIYAMKPDMSGRLAQTLTAHFQAGRIEPVFKPGIAVARSADDGAEAVAKYDPSNVEPLNAWLEGDSALWWRFKAGVARNDADLLMMTAGDELTIYADVGLGSVARGEAAWHRVNAGYILRRLQESGETSADYEYLGDQFTSRGVANCRQAAYELLEPHESGGRITPTGTTQRADIAVVSGGSHPSVVLQPLGVVPGELFSFITSDEVKVFSARLQSQPLRVRSAMPLLSRRALTSLGFRGVFRPNAMSEFHAVYLAQQLVFKTGGGGTQDFYNALADTVTYGVLGWSTGLKTGPGLERSFVLQGDASHRPDHPEWTPKLPDNAVPTAADPTPDHRDQLRRLFPLRYYLAAENDQDTDRLFAITQDETDCIRQEYVFHLNWVMEAGGLYYQGLATTSRDVTAGGHTEGTAGGQPTPRIGAITIPPRSRFRPLENREYDPILEGARPRYPTVTAAPANWRDVYDNSIKPTYADFLEGVKSIKNGLAPPAGLNLPPVVSRFITFLQSLPVVSTATADPVFDFLAQQLNLLAALQRLSLAANDSLQINSFWRPPEHNETVSELRNSPHQDSRGFDIQPSGGQSPLNLLTLHAAGERILPTPNLLSQVLLELKSNLFVSAGFREDLSQRVITKPAGKFRLVLVAGGPAVDLDAFSLANPLGEDEAFPDRGVPDSRLLKLFETEFMAFMTASGRLAVWPNPTVDRVYFFALGRASHVHFTVR